MISVVYSKAGRDKGKFMALIRETENGVLLCDGKERPIESPKLKNKKHVVFTNYEIGCESLNSNKALRKALAKFGAEDNFREELICQKKI